MAPLDRLVLGDSIWARMAPHIVGDVRSRGTSGRDNRMFVEGVLWVVRTGASWRDLPTMFGGWNSVFRRFSLWSCKGIWRRIFAAMAADPDFEYLIIDSTIIRAHQRVAGAKKSSGSGRWAFPWQPEHEDPPRRHDPRRHCLVAPLSVHRPWHTSIQFDYWGTGSAVCFSTSSFFPGVGYRAAFP